MITIIDYGLGNIGSVLNTFESLGVSCAVSSDPVVVGSAATLLLPGVGAAGVGMQNLKERGLDTVIRNRIQQGVPFIGFCLGLQLLFEYSEEADTPCLGVLKGKVVKFGAQNKVPQIGWNTVTVRTQNPRAVRLFNGIPNSEFYFVNSYYPEPTDPEIIAATTQYGCTFTSAVAYKNIFATQFHPEKSSTAGRILLTNFIKEIL